MKKTVFSQTKNNKVIEKTPEREIKKAADAKGRTPIVNKGNILKGQLSNNILENISNSSFHEINGFLVRDQGQALNLSKKPIELDLEKEINFYLDDSIKLENFQEKFNNELIDHRKEEPPKMSCDQSLITAQNLEESLNKHSSPKQTILPISPVNDISAWGDPMRSSSNKIENLKKWESKLEDFGETNPLPIIGEKQDNNYGAKGKP